MSRRNGNLLSILKNAGIVARGAFHGVHNPAPKRKTEYIRFIYKGNYYRRPIPAKMVKSKEPPELLKLPPAGQAVMPQPFLTPPPVQCSTSAAETLVASGKSSTKSKNQSWSWSSWWKLNGPLLVLNFGSVATLIGFTRSDVLELRALSVTGSLTFVIYTLLHSPIRWPSVFWSSIFASVNSYKIAGILHERQGAVVLTQREEGIYNEHFQPHGVTPKQFEKIMAKGTCRVVKRGGLICRQGVEVNTVKLVVKGSTRASTTGRHLTAIGSKPGNRDKFAGGDSGAWIGEMSFLQSLWSGHLAPKGVSQTRPKIQISHPENKPLTKREEPPKPVASAPKTIETPKFSGIALSTIVAVDDVEIIEWTFEDMGALMKTSGDMQGALTRAMTAAIVGKVANFMMSRQVGVPSIVTLLDNWKNDSLLVGEEEENEEVRMVPS